MNKSTKTIIKGLAEGDYKDEEGEKVTTIQLTVYTRKRLKQKMNKSDVYDGIINKLIDFHDNNKNKEGIIPLM